MQIRFKALPRTVRVVLSLMPALKDLVHAETRIFPHWPQEEEPA
jgi:hypothetical protein